MFLTKLIWKFWTSEKEPTTAESHSKRGNRMFTPPAEPEKPVEQIVIGPDKPVEKITVHPKGWVVVEFPTKIELETIGADMVRTIVGDEEKPNPVEPRQVAPQVAVAYKPVLTVVGGCINNALDKISAKIDEHMAKAPAIAKAFSDAIASAKSTFETAAKPHVEELRANKADQAAKVKKLRKEKRDLPQQIADAEFATTGDPRIRVERISPEEKDRLRNWTIAITGGLAFLDLFLTAVIFIGAVDERTGYLVGIAYLVILAWFMHQRAVYGRPVKENSKAKEASKFYLMGNPDEKRQVRDLSETDANGYFNATRGLLYTVVSMAVIRIVVAMITGKWASSLVAITVTIVVGALAYVGSEWLMQFASKYGDWHNTIGDMKDRFKKIDSEILAAEETAIVEPLGLSKAKTAYTLAIASARKTAETTVGEGYSSTQNASMILKGEKTFHTTATDSFVETCTEIISLVVPPPADLAEGEEDPGLEIKRADLLTHFAPTTTDHKLATQILDGGVNFDSMLPDLKAPSADEIVTALDQSTPVVVEPPPAPPKPEPAPRIKRVPRKVNLK